MNSSSFLTQIKKYFIDWLFPNRCGACGKVVRWDKLVCDRCERDMPVITDDLCEKCGKKICLDHSILHYDKVFSLFVYEGKCREAVHNLKYNKCINFAEYGANKLCDVLVEKGLADKVQLVTSVPMNRKKQSERGYNQADIIGRIVAKTLKKPYDNKLIGRRYTREEQHNLHADERKMLADSSYYKLKKHKDINGKCVVLCDDVYTTGATMNACSKLLKEEGADKIICVSIANTDYLSAKNK